MTSDETPRPIDPQVRIGHIHLKVADLDRLGIVTPAELPGRDRYSRPQSSRPRGVDRCAQT
jgi:hypothetical protein